MSLLAVQTVQAGHLTLRQMLTVMLGANIGLTVVVQLIAQDFDRHAPIVILFGVILYQFTRSPRSRGIGQVLLSLGFIFLAMGIIREAVAAGQLGEHPDFIKLLAIAERYPIVLALMAAVLTIVLQSSTATIGLIIGLGAAGVSMAIILPAVLYVGEQASLSITPANERLVAAAFAALVAWLTKNVWATVGGGMTALWLLQWAGL